MSAAVAVAEAHGVEVREPRVLSDRSNLLVRLAPAPVVARVATSTADARAGGARDWLARDVALGRHLAAAGADVVPPASELPAGPHVEDGLAIAFWRFVEHDPARAPGAHEAGEALRRLHEALEGFSGELPPFTAVLDECAAVIDRLEQSGSLGAAAPPSASPSGPPRPPAPGSSAIPPASSPRPPASPDLLRAALREIRSAIDSAALLAERHPDLRARAEARLSRWAAPR